MTSLWLHLSLLVAVALGSWIAQIDTTGNPAEAAVLWSATAFLTAWLVVRLLLRLR